MWKCESMPNSTIVSGFFAAYTPLEALLQSTLDCLYEIKCLQLLSGYFPALNHSLWWSRDNTSFDCIVFGSIIVLLLFNSLSTHTDTVTISNPSLITYKSLQTLHSATLNCPCATKAISYRSFVSVSPTLHQVCSSGFITDIWLTLLKRSSVVNHPDDWRNQAASQFQLLSDFCRLANKTTDDSVDRFLKQFFIASTVFNEIDFDTQLNATLKQLHNSTVFDFSLQNDAVSFTLPSIPEINSTVLTCVCATNPHCRALNVIYTSGLFHGMYDSPLINDLTRSRFPPNTLVSTIFKEMMVEQWNASWPYKNFYESCAPIHCTYSEKIRAKTIAGIILTLISVIGGLVVSLRLITPNVDPITAKRLGRWATRLYIALFIGGLCVLTVYTLIQPKMMTKTFDKPSFNVYNDLKKLYGDELKCPCSVIASVYSRFMEIKPIFHKICLSPFASEQWRINLTAGLVANLSIYTQRDYRRFLSAHLQFLRGLCELSMNATYNSVNQFLTSLLVTSELLSEINFHQKLESLIEQSKSNAPTTFRRLLFLIRTINHGNAFMSTYGTNFEYIVPKNKSGRFYAPTRALIYDDGCSCGLCSNCTIQANFITFNSSEIISIPIKGLKIGCTPSESFRASTLECFYDRSCINLIHQYTNYNNSHDPLSIMNSSFPINTTMAELIDSLFIERWSTETNYTSYFHQCSPSYCSYTSIQKSTLLDIITLLLSLQGGLTIVLKWICPKIVRITSKIKDYRKKRMNTVRPVLVSERTSSDISNTPVDNGTTNLETSSTPKTSPTITGRSGRRTSKVFFGCILLTSVIAALIIFSFYGVRQATSINMTNDTNLNPTTNTTMSTFSSTATPICKLEFRSISMNTSKFDLTPNGFVSADFNNDNRLDLVFYFGLHRTLNLLFGDGYENFGAKNIIAMKSFDFLSNIDVGDFNNDNRSDLVLTNSTHLVILLGNGNGAFRERNTLSLGTECSLNDITIADFNHDNYSDIAVVSMNNNNMCVFLGKGNGTFSSPFIFPTGHNSKPQSLNVGDFNSDGHLDIAVDNNNAVNVGVFIGCGNGTFEIQKRSFTIIGSNPTKLAVGDFDDDTHADVVIPNHLKNIVCILSGYSNGSFGVRQFFFINSTSRTPSVAVGDFNCDGHLDIAVGTTGPSGIDVLVGYGDVHFDTQRIFRSETIDKNIIIAVHDFNGDTYQDIIAIDVVLDTIDILLNICECCTRKIPKKSNFGLQ
ncbi:unnamed protein product [Adineta steineri]|uniref:Uncharacterized protein n=1 Tax=Adineta steineri TaxID=433720 RepID=A0A813TRF8_9BILA|nr:unnamed protein product [Adineta steineri]CAF3928594.1 unnamed protein product [Adineta steineri]